jgi:hypothetical protein
LRLVAVKFRSGANFVFEEIFVYIFCLFLIPCTIYFPVLTTEKLLPVTVTLIHACAHGKKLKCAMAVTPEFPESHIVTLGHTR